MLEKTSLTQLKDKKNLLAFSGGGDSTALFFLLLKNNIKFDIAIVNYGKRAQSEEEVLYAQELAKEYNLTCNVLNAEKIEQNFEATARQIRYNFFEELISTCSYENLLTAHHLGDRFEWMLMQFCKGAGCAELAGMQSIERRETYTLVRPLLHVDKSELIEYLHVQKFKYFEDETNTNEEIKRNSFRHNHSSPLLKAHLEGIKRSFNYLDEDRASLIQDIHVERIAELAYFKNENNSRNNIYTIDKYLKSQNYMLSAKERELLKSEITVVVGRKFVVNQSSFIFIAPYTDEKFIMPKEFKEQMRVLKIAPKLREYLYKNEDVFIKIKELLTS